MRRLQARTAVRFIIPIGRLTLLELSFGLSITELGPGPASELLLPVADDLILARDVSQSAEQRGNDDEDRPEEDEPSRGDRRDRPDRQYPDRPCNSTEHCTPHPISVVLLRRGIDLLHVELTESITLREDITDDRAIGIRGPDLPIRSGICAEPRSEGTGVHGECSNPAVSGETEDQPGIGLD